MIFLFLLLLTGALIVGFIQKYILRIKEPEVEELWIELEEQDWYRELQSDPQIEEFLNYSKRDGLLEDPYYVRKIIDKEGHRDGFIKHVKEKA
ncbi:hypothetical protein FZC84_11315 [Rossellomorea vietnamensis]|uniref:Uncharacterized protein n=1 Tax=Rossellomorea vietnamensis TaxID=218284 RepID=A0A5D4ME83_9BACI|nr:MULTISPECIES: hypothetical protein [Bacillaceae]TYR99335.1 hypothetical protein FZC84_11315 [Rossellomorea vietnamensis]